MAITYTWNLLDAETFPTSSDAQTPANVENDVIHAIRCELVASDTVDEVVYNRRHLERIEMNVTDLSNFSSFDSLSEGTVVGWVTESIKNTSPYPNPIEYIKGLMSASLALEINPVSETKFFNY